VTRINALKVRFLGDKVLQRKAWKVADQLGWETTYDAEFVALTQLQADVFVTSEGDLARAVSGLGSCQGRTPELLPVFRLRYYSPEAFCLR